MNNFEVTNRDNLDARLTRALEATPPVSITDDFATRVMQRLPARRRVILPSEIAAPQIARRVASGSLLVLFIAMIVLALHAHGAASRSYTVIEGALAAEFMVLTVWISLRSQRIS